MSSETGHHVGDPAGIVEQRRLGGQQDALPLGARRGRPPARSSAGLAGLEHLGVEHEVLGRMLLAVDLLERAPDRGRRVDPVELLVGAVDQGQAAAAVDRADRWRARCRSGAAGATRWRAAPPRAARCWRPARAAARRCAARAASAACAGSGDCAPGRGTRRGRPGSGGSRWRPPPAPGSSRCGPRRPSPPPPDVARARQGAERADEVGAVHARHLVVGDHQVGQGDQDRSSAACGPANALTRLLLDRRGQPGKYVPIGHPVIDDDDIGIKRTRRSFSPTDQPGRKSASPSCLAEGGMVFIKQKVKSGALTPKVMLEALFAVLRGRPGAPVETHWSNGARCDCLPGGAPGAGRPLVAWGLSQSGSCAGSGDPANAAGFRLEVASRPGGHKRATLQYARSPTAGSMGGERTHRAERQPAARPASGGPRGQCRPK